MEAFTVLSGCVPPFAHGLGLEAKGGFDGRNRAAIADQRDQTDDGRLVSAPTKEGCPSPCAEGLAANLTLEARWLLAMTANVALPALPSCGAVHIGMWKR